MGSQRVFWGEQKCSNTAEDMVPLDQASYLEGQLHVATLALAGGVRL